LECALAFHQIRIRPIASIIGISFVSGNQDSTFAELP
jgi:hypothetical protein